jgi:hypothetical protein
MIIYHLKKWHFGDAKVKTFQNILTFQKKLNVSISVAVVEYCTVGL